MPQDARSLYPWRFRNLFSPATMADSESLALETACHKGVIAQVTACSTFLGRPRNDLENFCLGIVTVVDKSSLVLATWRAVCNMSDGKLLG